MHHSEPVAPFSGDRSRICPCGAVAERPWSLCHKCLARCAWRRKSFSKNRQIARRQATRHSRQARDAHRARQLRNGLKNAVGTLCPRRVTKNATKEIAKGAENR